MVGSLRQMGHYWILSWILLLVTLGPILVEGTEEEGVLQGCLVRLDRLTPIHNQPVKLFAVSSRFFGLLTNKTPIGAAETTEKGEFQFTFPYSDIKASNVKYLILEVESAPSGLFAFCDTYIFDSIVVERPESQITYLKHPIAAEVLEYDINSSNRFQPKNTRHIPKPNNTKFVVEMIDSAWDEILKTLKINVLKDGVTTDIVQKLYGIGTNKNQHDSDTLVRMIFEYYDPRALEKGDGDDQYILKINHERYSKAKQDIDLPNVNVYLRKDDTIDIGIKIERIDLDFHRNGSSQIETYLEEEKVFPKALRALGNVLFLLGQFETHLGRGHLMSGQYAMAMKNFIKSPIAKLLAPCLKGVLRINHLGGPLIFGETGVLNIALDQEGIKQILQDEMASLNYNWKPCPSRFSGDRFGQLKNLLYHSFSKGVSEFLENNRNEIEKHKYEIYRFSEDLVNYSFAYRPYQGKTDMGNWIDSSEVNLRPFKEDDDAKAFEPIMIDAETLDDRGWESLEKALTHFLYLASYHDIVHHEPARWLNMQFATLSPRNQDITQIEDLDPYMGTKPIEANNQLAVGKALFWLENVDKETLLTDPDIVDEIKKPFQDNLEEFLRLGFDPKTGAETVKY